MVEIGQVAIIAAFVVTVYSAVVGFCGGIPKKTPCSGPMQSVRMHFSRSRVP